MEGHEPKATDSSNNTADTTMPTAGSSADAATNSSKPEDSEYSKDANGVHTKYETGAKDDYDKWERIMPDGGHEDDNTVEDDVEAANIAMGDAPKKKKKKSKPKSQRATKAGTGFEEYYVDAPLKPEEHEEEKGLYHVSLPFAQRIETAIQRYAGKRNMDSTRKNIFDKYLSQGGIDSGPKIFSGGLDSQTLETKDAKDIALLTATNFVDFDKTDPRNGLYEVDFEGCLRSFLSHTVPTTFDLTSEEYIKSIVNVIRNFLNYLLYHDVCSEYNEQIKSSKSLCDKGERELWAISQNTLDLPGTFNKACSELYGGIYQGQWAAASAWLSEEDSDGMAQGISPALARQVFKLAIVANTSEEQFKKYEEQNSAQSIHITSVEDISMEVVKAIPSNDEVQHLYGSRGDLNPIGRLLTKTWHNPFGPAEDLTEDEERARANSPKETKFYEFWLEDEILRNCFPGMKLDVTVTELSIGISYFDKIEGIYCSFFDISPNAQMAGWRKPEGEGNWLPPRAIGGGPLEDEDGKGGAGGDDVDETALGNAVNGTEEVKEVAEETTKDNEVAKEVTENAIKGDEEAVKA